MTVLVTGANGHLGAHLVRLLLREGYSVRAFVRDTGNITAIAHLDIDLRNGDVLEPSSLRKAMHGCEAVFHLAAPTRIVRGLRESIVAGTRNVISSAAACGVCAVIYTSSIVTIGYSKHPDFVLDESHRNCSLASPYHAAKFVGESVALEWARKGDLKIVVVNPATVVGSLDYRVTPSSEVIQRALNRGLPFTFNSGLTVAPVRDVAMGHILALRRGQCGERYILGGERLTVADYFSLIEDCCGRRRARIYLPRSVLLGFGALGSSLKVFGKRVPFTLTQARLVGKYGFYSSQKAMRELGYDWKSARHAITDYVEWVRAGRPASAW
jgi:dihydroflavonol-4-reductase